MWSSPTYIYTRLSVTYISDISQPSFDIRFTVKLELFHAISGTNDNSMIFTEEECGRFKFSDDFRVVDRPSISGCR